MSAAVNTGAGLRLHPRWRRGMRQTRREAKRGLRASPRHLYCTPYVH